MPRYQNNKRDFEDMSSFTSKSDYNRSKKAKKKKKGLKRFLCVFFGLLILLGGGAIFAANYLFGGLTTRSITKDKEQLGISSGTFSHPQVTNIALYGLDSRGNDFEGRSDSIMVLTLDQVHNKVKLTSVLRDSLVYIGAGTSDGYDKINHAYAYGGPELAIKALNYNFGLNIEDYVTVNFSKMTNIVDAFGGVDIEVSDMEVEQINKNLGEIIRKGLGATDADYLDSSSGLLHLNGAQAVAFSRIRTDSDNARAGRQQIVLTALLQKATNISALELPSLVSQLSSLCETSLDTGEMLGFIPFAASGFKIEKLVIPGDIEGDSSGYTENGGWVWKYDLDVAAKHIHEFIYEDASNTGDTDGNNADSGEANNGE